ncbi:MAG: hypothetical protein E6R13_10025 [Spirochaetes bacterium]|jgi:hypothetical protein|nr:MAG: hypothetical protein E6R13_10025 [Spirochaetota bacterium]
MTPKEQKEKLQKRNILIQRLLFLFELDQYQSVSRTLCNLVSPIGENVHPYKWTDNELLGKVEKAIQEAEETNLEDERLI